jgi:hypothetical protein
MSRKTTRETLLREKRGTHDLSAWTGLVLHKMVGIFDGRKTGIVADLAEWCIGRTDPTIGKSAFTDRNRNRNRNTGRSLGILTTRQRERTISILADSERNLRA